MRRRTWLVLASLYGTILSAQSTDQASHAPRLRVSCMTAPLLPRDTVHVQGLTITQSIRVDVVDDLMCLGVIYTSKELVARYIVFLPPCVLGEPWVRDNVRYKDVPGATIAILASHCPPPKDS